MKLALDLTALCRRHTGMEYYALNLSRALLETDGQDEFHLFFRREIHPELRAFADRAVLHLSPFGNQVATEQGWIPHMERKINPQLIHFPAFPPGLLSKTPKVATVFDSTLWRKTERLSWKAKTYFAPLAGRALKNSRKILTISQNAKLEIAAAAKVPEEKIAVSYPAPDPVFEKAVTEENKQTVRVRYTLPERFILSVATLEPRKNLTGLLSSFARLIERAPEARLILAGRLAWGKDAVLKRIAELKLEKQTRVLGYVPKEDLPALYALADFLAFPSFYEGFGLPVLEAQAVGTPVLCSNTSSLPEVAGTSAFFVDPHAEESIAAGLIKLWNDNTLKKELVRKGKENTARFSWRQTAAATRAVYEEVLNG
ncbi:MAG: glycosyltransferase family 4 protein [candidate division Zixibacteria bacterium]|nr:glycosyltransferase family 4 protein [candidate division Zixibacteria bacterium]MCI0595220.1 glycosyltransferase family 4 protein [candidate division Zixibacteria bacterium]